MTLVLKITEEDQNIISHIIKNGDVFSASPSNGFPFIFHSNLLVQYGHLLLIACDALPCCRHFAQLYVL